MSRIADAEQNFQKPAGHGDFFPILNLNQPGTKFLGEFVSFKSVTKEVDVEVKEKGKLVTKTEERTFNIFTFKAVEAVGLDCKVGDTYSIFASGKLNYELGSLAENAKDFAGVEVLILYKGMSEIKKGPNKGKKAHNYEVKIGSGSGK